MLIKCAGAHSTGIQSYSHIVIGWISEREDLNNNVRLQGKLLVYINVHVLIHYHLRIHSLPRELYGRHAT